MISECRTDVLVSFAESLHVSTGLMAVAVVCGLLTGILSAALVYHFCLKHLLLTRQGYNIRRLLEPDNAENHQSESVSNKNEAASVSAMDKGKKQENPPVSSDVAAFATRAKVVYPINQKYRPLADGASNPSLHEASALPPLPADCSSSSDDEESEDEEQNEDCSQYVSSSLLPKSLQNTSFTSVPNYPLTLTLIGFESRINLYCLALRDVQQTCVQLQEEKSLIYSQILKTIFGNRFPKNKQESDFYKNILQMQEKELNALRKLFPCCPPVERNESVITLEEIERAQKELLEAGLQMCRGFSQQVEDLSQCLLKKTSVVPPEEAHSIISSIIKSLLIIEDHLNTSQHSDLRRIQQKVLWWEELTALLQSQPALLKKELSSRQTLITTALEQLTSDDILTFSQMDKVLSAIQCILNEGFKQFHQECTKKTKDVVSEKMNKLESKKRRLQKNQNKEIRVSQNQTDLQETVKVHEEVLVKHKKQVNDLEQQQDDRLTETLCDLWKKLRISWTQRLTDQLRGVLQSSLSSESVCEEVWREVEQKMDHHLHQNKSSIRVQLQEVQAQLETDKQMWSEEMTLVEACLQHLSDTQTKILQRLLHRQSYTLHSEVSRLVQQKHSHLLGAVQRWFVVRRFSLSLVKEMRLSKLKVMCQTDFRSVLLEDRNQGCASAKNSSVSLAERLLAPEAEMTGNSLLQEFLSELETGTELLQSHIQRTVGGALSLAVQLQPTDQPPTSSEDYNMKCHLTEAASESVYLTKDSLTALVKKYYSQLQDITKKLYQDPPKLDDDVDEKQESSSQITKSVLRELENWSKKPSSVEFQQRVELHKQRFLDQCEREQQSLYEDLRYKKVSREVTLDKIKTQLMEAEEDFIEELAALARVSLNKPETEAEEEEQTGDVYDPGVNLRELLAKNPALDPALNPSLTPLISAPVKIVIRDKNKKSLK